jgi:hypothetical protein
LTRITRKRAVLGIAAMLASFAAVAPVSADASCHEVITDGGCVEQAACAVGDRLGFQCVD